VTAAVNAGKSTRALSRAASGRMALASLPTAALAAELIAHCREHLARFKCPREVRFAVVPKTSTGKIQKHVLRSDVKSSSAI